LTTASPAHLDVIVKAAHGYLSHLRAIESGAPQGGGSRPHACTNSRRSAVECIPRYVAEANATARLRKGAALRFGARRQRVAELRKGDEVTGRLGPSS